MAVNLKLEADKALAHLNAGQPKSALKVAKSALRSAPNEPFFANIAGLATSATGNPRGAIAFFQKATRAKPDFIDGHRNLAQTLIVLGEDAKAEAYLGKLRGKFPNDAVLLYLLAQALTKQGRFTEAEKTATEALEINPKMTQALNLRGVNRRHLNNLLGAISDYQRSLEINPKDLDAMVNISTPLSLLSRPEEAREYLEKALEIAPENPLALEHYAGLMHGLNKKPEAINAFNRLLSVQEESINALLGLAGLVSSEESLGLAHKLESAYKRSSKSPRDRGRIGFALYELYNRLRMRDEAIHWLGIGNKYFATGGIYSLKEEERQQELIFSKLAEQPAPPVNTHDSGVRPIFVVGLMRSGTTLTEQVLSAHSTVIGVGESAAAAYLTDKILTEDTPFDSDAARDFAQKFRATLPEFPQGTQAFVDKMPGNVRVIGWLKSAFPDCRIVNLARDPRAVAWSIWRNAFGDGKHPYAYRWDWMAQHVNHYGETIARWHELYPGEVFDLEYQSLVSDIDGTSRKLAEFCGLDWEPGMASPEKNDSFVMTASIDQVRQGVHTKSVAGWRKYEDVMRPFIDGLEPKFWSKYLD